MIILTLLVEILVAQQFVITTYHLLFAIRYRPAIPDSHNLGHNAQGNFSRATAPDV
jgi:hypothetical protein